MVSGTRIRRSWRGRPTIGRRRRCRNREQRFAEYAWLLTKAAGVTVVLACLAMPLAMLIGLLVAVGRLYGPRWLDWLLTVYVELLRGTPVLMQLFVIYYCCRKSA